MPCQLTPGRKNPSDDRMAAMLIVIVPFGPLGMETRSRPSSPSQLPCVYLTATVRPTGWYVVELETEEEEVVKMGLRHMMRLLSFVCPLHPRGQTKTHR